MLTRHPGGSPRPVARPLLLGSSATHKVLAAYTLIWYIQCMKQFLLKVDTDIYEAWKKQAIESGLSVSEWIRRKCNSDSVVAETADARSLQALAHSAYKGRVAGVAGNAQPVRTQPSEGSSPSRATKKCKHGTLKGWNCWQCGGLAVIE